MCYLCVVSVLFVCCFYVVSRSRALTSSFRSSLFLSLSLSLSISLSLSLFLSLSLSLTAFVLYSYGCPIRRGGRGEGGISDCILIVFALYYDCSRIGAGGNGGGRNHIALQPPSTSTLPHVLVVSITTTIYINTSMKKTTGP